MRLSRKYDVQDFTKLTFASESDWQMAIGILEDRFETRYLEHIRFLLKRPTSGFAVLTLDSALIETVEQFRRGEYKTPRYHGERFFVSFFTETAFSKFFSEDSAKIFYKTIRCGLLHQAEAESNSRLKRGADLPLVSLTSDHLGIVINTAKFHNLLETCVAEYLSMLRTGRHAEYRQRFLRKMKYICRSEERPPSKVQAA